MSPMSPRPTGRGLIASWSHGDFAAATVEVLADGLAVDDAVRRARIRRARCAASRVTPGRVAEVTAYMKSRPIT